MDSQRHESGGLRGLLLFAAAVTVGMALALGHPAQASGETAIADADHRAHVQTLAAREEIRSAFSFIEARRDTANEELVTLTEVPAPPFQEDKRAAVFAEMLRRIGVQDVVIDEVGNVLGRMPGRTGKRTVAVAAHLDTVFPAGTDTTVHREGRVFRAPGVGDDTRSLVVLLTVADAILRHNLIPRDDILIIGTVGEEGLGDLRGVKNLFRPGGPRIDSFIAIDGGGLSRLVVNGLGSRRYRVTFKGPGGHSWGAFGLANPAHALARSVVRFIELADPLTRRKDKATINVGRIGGGTSVNSIPFEAWLEVDMRSVNPELLAEAEAAFLQAVKEGVAAENRWRRRGKELAADVVLVGDRPAAKGNPRSDLAQFAAASLELLGEKPRLATGSTDANIPIDLGIPAITLSRGGITRHAHSLDEEWEDVDAHKAPQALLLTLLAEAGYPPQ